MADSVSPRCSNRTPDSVYTGDEQNGGKIFVEDECTGIMANGLFFLLIGLPIIFAFFVGASYVGTKHALRSYFEGEDPPSGLISIEDDEKGR